MLIRFVGTRHRTIESVQYAPGQVADVSALWADVLIKAGEAEVYIAPLASERVAVPEYGHRDTFRA